MNFFIVIYLPMSSLSDFLYIIINRFIFWGKAVFPGNIVRLTAKIGDYAPQLGNKGCPTFTKATESITGEPWYTKSSERKEALQFPKMLRLQLQKD
jgi:hypothetical protein